MSFCIGCAGIKLPDYVPGFKEKKKTGQVLNLVIVKFLSDCKYKGSGKMHGYGGIIGDEFKAQFTNMIQSENMTLYDTDFYSKDLNERGLLDHAQVESLAEHLERSGTLNKITFKELDVVVVGKVEGNVEENKGIEDIIVEEGTGKYKSTLGIKTEIKRKKVLKKAYKTSWVSLSIYVKVVDLKTFEVILTDRVNINYDQKFGGKNAYKALFPKRISDMPPPDRIVRDLSTELAEKLIDKIKSPLTAYQLKKGRKAQYSKKETSVYNVLKCNPKS